MAAEQRKGQGRATNEDVKITPEVSRKAEADTEMKLRATAAINQEGELTEATATAATNHNGNPVEATTTAINQQRKADGSNNIGSKQPAKESRRKQRTNKGKTTEAATIAVNNQQRESDGSEDN